MWPVFFIMLGTTKETGMSEQQGTGTAESEPVVRPMREEDLEAGVRLAAAAGWNQRLDDWRLVRSLSPETNFVAILDGRLAGTTVTINYDNKVSWVAMVLVDPTLRRRGVATRLMKAALDALAACETVKLDATPAGREVYLRLGFVDESTVVRFQAASAPAPVPPPAGVRLRRMTEADTPAVLALDARAFGTLRDPLMPGLSRLAPGYAWVAEGPAGLQGFCMGRHGMKWEHLGPVTAVNGETARALASAAFGAMAGKPALVDAPSWQPGFQAWLKESGFVEQRPFIRMRKGPDRHAGEAGCVFGIAGPEFG
jgi:GNAT superfamily N-acetyltransferase